MDEAANGLMAQKLGGPAIDWNKQMLVTVAAGLRGGDVDRLAVTRVEVKDRTMTVFYRLSGSPARAASVTRPRRSWWTASTAPSTPRKNRPRPRRAGRPIERAVSPCAIPSR